MRVLILLKCTRKFKMLKMFKVSFIFLNILFIVYVSCIMSSIGMGDTGKA